MIAGTAFDLLVYLANVFSDDSKGEKYGASDKPNRNKHGRPTCHR